MYCTLLYVFTLCDHCILYIIIYWCLLWLIVYCNTWLGVVYCWLFLWLYLMAALLPINCWVCQQKTQRWVSSSVTHPELDPCFGFGRASLRPSLRVHKTRQQRLEEYNFVNTSFAEDTFRVDFRLWNLSSWKHYKTFASNANTKQAWCCRWTLCNILGMKNMHYFWGYCTSKSNNLLTWTSD